jgi:hypothetical protein
MPRLRRTAERPRRANGPQIFPYLEPRPTAPGVMGLLLAGEQPDHACLLSTYLRNVLISSPELGYCSHRIGYGAAVAIGRQLPASIV